MAIACVAGGSCSRPPAEPSDQTDEERFSASNPPDTETLLEWANELGSGELARLAAAEMMYRNRTYDHLLQSNTGAQAHAYLKLYREFNGFTVEDVDLSSSILHPVTYTIRYDFELWMTKPRRGDPSDKELRAEARADYVFWMDRSESLTRVYGSGSDFRPVNEYSPYLERPNYWSYRTSELFGDSWSLRDDSGLDR